MIINIEEMKKIDYLYYYKEICIKRREYISKKLEKINKKLKTYKNKIELLIHPFNLIELEDDELIIKEIPKEYIKNQKCSIY